MTGICPLVPHHSGTPAGLVASSLSFRGVTSEIGNIGIPDYFRSFNSIKFFKANRVFDMFATSRMTYKQFKRNTTS